MLDLKRKNIISFVLVSLVSLSCCSEGLSEYEEKIKKEALTYGLDLSRLQIKERALILKNWSSMDYFEKDIQKFLDEDKTNPPPKNGILFIGSSSIVMWKTLEKDMHPFQAINRGFGGAHISHINNYLEDIVFPYEPKGIVFFSGSNDIFALKTPQEVFKDFLYFYQNVKTHLPLVKIFVIGIKPSIARNYQREKQLIWNNSVSDLTIRDQDLYFIDVRPAMLLENGKANPALFVADGLHMNSKGYEIWTKLVRPYLESNFKPYNN